jgi:diguanylate cyclase (GGDEF)-like protein
MDIAELGRGMDTSTPPPVGAPGHSMNGDAGSPRGGDPLLAGVRRLTLLADSAQDAEAIFGTLARELMHTPGADEIHVHHLSAEGGGKPERTVIYLFEGEGRLSYLTSRDERPPGVSWVVSTGRSFLAADGNELVASVPRLAQVSGGEPGPVASALLLPLTVRGEVEAVVLLVRRGSAAEAFTDRSTELASTLVDQAATALALLRARAEAGTDTVTGCMNHRGMRRQLHEEVGRATRAGTPLSAMLIDLDNFKLVNDRHGHPAGDALLREVGQTLVREFREFDRVARYGGDEFVVILPNAELEPAAAAAQRALERLLAISSFDETPGASASIGVAQWQAPMTIDELLAACDAALLRSKRQGKRRVTRASAPAAN